MFDYGPLHQRFYTAWLAGQGLIAVTNGMALEEATLTDEGWSVLRMLEATRPRTVGSMRATRASIDTLIALSRIPPEGEERRSRTEAESLTWDARFIRESVGGQFTISLAVRGDGPIEMMQTVWVLAFRDEQVRDAFYTWLCLRVDRWADWAELAWTTAASKLTEHLLIVIASSAAAPPTGHRPSVAG